MNFVINIPGDRPIGTVDISGRSKHAHLVVASADLHHFEYRQDHATGKGFVALVYELPERGR